MKEIKRSIIKKRHILKIKKTISDFEKEIKPYMEKLKKNTFTDDIINKGAELEQSIDDLKNILHQVECPDKRSKYLNSWVIHVLEKYNIINQNKRR